MPLVPTAGANIARMRTPSHDTPAQAPRRGLARLWQPRRALFWLMVAANLLSSFWGWLLRTDTLAPAGMAVVGVFALANAGAGMWLAWRLLRGD